MNDFARRRANEARVFARASDSLLGICAGLIADAQLNEKEVQFLGLWLREHEDIASTWPGSLIRGRVKEILADGRIEDSELAHLQETLAEALGGGWEESGAADGLATTLPIQSDAVVSIPEHSFCFTGRFAFGTRAACERAVVVRGGEVSTNVVMNLDYLVIGTFVTPDWANTSYGRKIEKAVSYRDAGRPLQIISERAWCAVIKSA